MTLPSIWCHGGTCDRIFAGWNSHRGHGTKWNAPKGMDYDGLIFRNGSDRGARLKKFGKDGSGVRGLIGAGFTCFSKHWKRRLSAQDRQLLDISDDCGSWVTSLATFEIFSLGRIGPQRCCCLGPAGDGEKSEDAPLILIFPPFPFPCCI